MNGGSTHRSVLLEEALEALQIHADGAYVDGTYGRGGHSRAILARLDARGRLLAIDKDPEAVVAARRELAADPRFAIRQGSFAEMRHMIADWGRGEPVDGVLLDLGVSSPQLEDPARGFSFLHDGPLDMRMDPGRGRSAADWLARAPEAEIAEVLKRYGEERYARRIARAIVSARRDVPITTTARLAAIVAKANPAWEQGKHPATRSFQAIRILVNDELADLEAGLEESMLALRPGGRMAVISFHSLEDRVVKRFIRREARGVQPPPGLAVREADIVRRLRPVGKALRPASAEVAANPRARSAVMRVAERLG